LILCNCSHRVLHICTGIHDLGPINWELALCYDLNGYLPLNQFFNIFLLQYRDALIIATDNVLTAFFAGFVIFGNIGFLAFELGTTGSSCRFR